MGKFILEPTILGVHGYGYQNDVVLVCDAIKWPLFLLAQDLDWGINCLKE